MSRGLQVLGTSLALLLLLAPGGRADAYSETMTGALAKYGAADSVPASSVNWIARTYGKSPNQVRRDLASLVPPPPEPSDAAAEAAAAAAPEAPPAKAAAPSKATTSAGFTLPASLKSSAMDAWAAQQGLPTWTFRLVRGLFAVLLLICAVPLWAAPRSLQDASPHVRSASVGSVILPRLIALYLVVASLWEFAGTYDPERFQLGRWITVVQEVGPPIRDAVKGLPIFQK